MTLTTQTTHDHAVKIRTLMAETRAHGGLAPVDLDRFWADQERARKSPFGADIPQVAVDVRANCG